MTSVEFHSNLFTALAYYTIGVALIVVSVKIYQLHPVNRVFVFGKYLTEEGMKVVMRHWPLVTLFGLFIFSCGIEHHLHWLYSEGNEEILQWLLLSGWVEAGISAITASVVVWMLLRWGYRRWGHH